MKLNIAVLSDGKYILLPVNVLEKKTFGGYTFFCHLFRGERYRYFISEYSSGFGICGPEPDNESAWSVCYLRIKKTKPSLLKYRINRAVKKNGLANGPKVKP